MDKPRVIQGVGRESESCHCRGCSFSISTITGVLVKAKAHSSKTGHTVDVYYETHRQVTYYQNGKNQWKGKLI